MSAEVPCACTDALARLHMLEMYSRVTCKLCGKYYEKLPRVLEPGGWFAENGSDEVWENPIAELGGEAW